MFDLVLTEGNYPVQPHNIRLACFLTSRSFHHELLGRMHARVIALFLDEAQAHSST
jgi:hypothetical protein